MVESIFKNVNARKNILGGAKFPQFLFRPLCHIFSVGIIYLAHNFIISLSNYGYLQNTNYYQKSSEDVHRKKTKKRTHYGIRCHHCSFSCKAASSVDLCYPSVVGGGYDTTRRRRRV
jgi:hypothetical protein